VNRQISRWGVVIVCAGVVRVLAPPAPVAGQDRTANIPTPPEITIQQTPPGQMFADVKGFALYVTERDREPGKSTCYGPCTVEWIPVRASADAKPFGDWTLVPRDDGAPQWAYKGRPFYRYAREAKPRWAEGQGDQWRYALVSPFPARGEFGRGRAGAGFLAGSPQRTKIPLPADVPGGITGQPNPRGPVFADGKGLTLYSSAASTPCTGQCLEQWRPLTAPLLAATPTGDWTIVNRPDGTPQWAYKGKPLYRSVKDVKAGDTNGDGGEWHALRVPGAAASGPTTAAAQYGR